MLWITPWTARNARLTGAFLPIHPDGEYNFYLGNGFVRHWRQAPFSYDEIAAAPAFLLRKLVVQSLTFWYLAGDTSKSMLSGAMQLPVVLLALPGIGRAIKRRSWASLLFVPIIGIMGVSVLIFAFARLAVYGAAPIVTRYLNI